MDHVQIISGDSEFSLKGSQIKNFCLDINNAYNTIKNKKFTRSKDENENKFFRRSIYAVSDIKKGDAFGANNIKTLRPSLGLSASYYLKINNKKSPINIKKNVPLSKRLIKLLGL